MRPLRVVPALLLVLVMAAACPFDRAKYSSNSVDMERSSRLAADPWLAPAEVRHGGLIEGHLLDREEVSRKYEAPARPDFVSTVVASEIQTALQHGWEITWAQCGPRAPLASPDFKPDSDSLVALVDLRKSASDLDHAAFAELTAYKYSSTGLGTPDKITVRAVAYPPYHADKGWPSLPAVKYEDTCLANPQAPAVGIRTTPAFPDGLALGLARSQPLNEKGEPDKSAN